MTRPGIELRSLGPLNEFFGNIFLKQSELICLYTLNYFKYRYLLDTLAPVKTTVQEKKKIQTPYKNKRAMANRNISIR